MRRLLFFMVMAGLICAGTQTASAVNYIDTVLIYWNNIDTLSGVSIAADSAPRIQIYKAVTGAPSQVVSAQMTQDTAGVYYYAFAIPDVSTVYAYRIKWTSQGKAYVWARGLISADHLQQGIDSLYNTFDSVFRIIDTIYTPLVRIDSLILNFTDTSQWMTQQEFDSNLYVAIVEGGNEVMPGLAQNSSFEGDSIQGSAVPDGWTKLEGTGTTTYHATHGSQRSSEYDLHLGRWMYRMRLSGGDTVIYYQRLYLTPGLYAMTGYLLLYSDLLGGCVVTMFIDSSAAPTLFNYKDTIKVTAGIDNTLQQYSKIIRISATGYYSFGIRYVHNGGTTTFCQIDNMNLFPISPLIVIADTTQSGATFGSIDYALVGQAAWNNTYVTEANRTANMAEVSGSVTAADNLEAMLIGTTPRKTLTANIAGFTWSPANNIVTNGLFETDSVTSTTAPSMWTNYSMGADLTANNTVTATRFGRWNYSVGGNGTDTIIYYQGIGYLNPGKYILHGVASNRGGVRSVIFIDTCLTDDCATLTTLTGDYIDSIYQAATTSFRLLMDTITLPATDKPFVIGFKFYSNSSVDSGIFANIGLIPGVGTASAGAGGGAESTAVYGAMAQVVDDSNLTAPGTDSGTVYGAAVQAIQDYGIDTTDIGLLAQHNPLWFYGPSAGAGSGTTFIRYWVINDSTSPDSSVAYATVGVRAMNGSLLATVTTGTAGSTVFQANPGDSLIVTGFKPGYIFYKTDTILVPDTTVYTDTMLCYGTFITSLCRVSLYVEAPDKTPVEGAVVYAKARGSRLRNTCDGTVLAHYGRVSNPSDATGYVYMDLIKTSCISGANAGKYDFQIQYPSGEITEIPNVTVPDSSTYQLTW